MRIPSDGCALPWLFGYDVCSFGSVDVSIADAVTTFVVGILAALPWLFGYDVCSFGSVDVSIADTVTTFVVWILAALPWLFGYDVCSFEVVDVSIADSVTALVHTMKLSLPMRSQGGWVGDIVTGKQRGCYGKTTGLLWQYC